MHRTKQKLATDPKDRAATCRASFSLEALARAGAEACSAFDAGLHPLAPPTAFVSSSWDKYSDAIAKCYPDIAITRLPWALGFPHLISFFEMILYPAEQLCVALLDMLELEIMGETEINNRREYFDLASDDYKHKILSRFEYVRQQCKRIELSAIERYVERKIRLHASTLNTPAKVMHEARSIKEQIQESLWERRFVYIPIAKANLFLSMAKDWEKVWAHFPEDVEKDSREAIECYSLGKNTACVFHLMRAVEYGMRDLAASLKIKKVKTGKTTLTPLSLAEWETVIQAIEDETAKLAHLRRGTKRDAKQTFYSAAALDLRAFKLAFRNHVMHSRVHYDEQEALLIIAHVKSFMERVAGGPT